MLAAQGAADRVSGRAGVPADVRWRMRMLTYAYADVCLTLCHPQGAADSVSGRAGLPADVRVAR